MAAMTAMRRRTVRTATKTVIMAATKRMGTIGKADTVGIRVRNGNTRKIAGVDHGVDRVHGRKDGEDRDIARTQSMDIRVSRHRGGESMIMIDIEIGGDIGTEKWEIANGIAIMTEGEIG